MTTRRNTTRRAAGTALALAMLVGFAACSSLGEEDAATDGGPSTTASMSPTSGSSGEPDDTDETGPDVSDPLPETTTTLPETTTTTEPPAADADGTLESGESGPSVQALQERLVGLGYWIGTPDGSYGQLTRQAVMAFQKVEGLSRDGVAGPATLERLAVAGRPAPLDPNGTHLEIDLARQVLMMVSSGQVQWVVNTSTGNGEAYANAGGGTSVAVTPAGTFAIDRQIDGLREAPLGTLYRPKYFNQGIAVHGAGDIPAHPASHGCARVTNSAMDMLWSSGLAEIGTPVIVY